MAPANQPKKGQFMNFSQGHSGTKVRYVKIVLVFLRKKKPEFTKKGDIHELFVLALSLVWFAGATPCFFVIPCFFFLRGIPCFLSVFPFFSKDFRGSAGIRNPCFSGSFPCLFPKKQGKEGQGSSGTNFCTGDFGDFACPEPEFRPEFWEPNFGRPKILGSKKNLTLFFQQKRPP